MNSLSKSLSIEFPLFAFSHCRDVVVAVSKAGGFGVLGASRFTPAELEIELAWIDDHIGDSGYGVDILVPEHHAYKESKSIEDMVADIPARHQDFIVTLLNKHGITLPHEDVVERTLPFSDPAVGNALMDVAFRHPIKLIANALGVPPQSMIDRGRANGVPVAALVGAKEHAIRQVRAGVDIIIAQGTEAGGHCGEVTTLVLVPEVLQAIRSIRDVPVLAAGGIMNGRQMAGCMAMGASGAWTGSVWLATTEAETSTTFKSKMVQATSRDTVRSRFRTGKPSRQLRSAWHDAWEADASLGALPMPLMSMLTRPALSRIDGAADNGNDAAKELVTYWVGQGVGLVDAIRSADRVVQDFKTEFADALHDLMAFAEA